MAAVLAMVLIAVIALGGCDAAPIHLQLQMPSPRAPSLGAADSTMITEAQVSRAPDGNSLDARLGGNRTLVGYLGAATPFANQPCGQEALSRNRELAGQRVMLEEDSAFLFDENGRRLFYAYTADGVSIDETLVREGLARAVRTNARYGAYLAALQVEAEAERRGCLWSSAAAP